MAVQETNLRAVLTLIDEMSPVLKSVQKELRAASRDIQDGFEGIKGGPVEDVQKAMPIYVEIA